MKMAIDVQRLSRDTRREVKSGGLGQDLTLNTKRPELFVWHTGYLGKKLKGYGIFGWKIKGIRDI